MHIPKEFIFPTTIAEYFGVKIKMPNNPDQICKFLYGPNWKIPLQKGLEYKTIIWKHKPFMIRGRFIILLVKFFMPYKSKPFYRIDILLIIIIKKTLRYLQHLTLKNKQN
jgi:hypothetical protein